MQDPLNQILERHLFKASTEGESSRAVVEAILSDYMRLLHTQGVNIPQTVKKYFEDDIREEIQEMIIRRTHASISCETAPLSVRTICGQSRKIS